MIKMLIATLCVLSSLCGGCKKTPSDGGGDEPPVFQRYATDIIMQSDRLGIPVMYSVYLPASYTADTERRYPVVYLLHGYGDNHRSWNDKWLNVSATINTLEASGAIDEMIYVMPQGFRTYYVNRYNGTYNYMDMFADELVPYIDKIYRTRADAAHRACIGYSMGGFGAMILPSKHPELFSVSIPLSMSFRTDEQYMTESAGGWNGQWGDIFGGSGTVGEARLTDYYKAHCPFYMFTAEGKDTYSGVHYFLDCGDDEEQLSVANDRLHRQMRDIGMAHEYRVRNGAHTSEYWRTGMLEALPYVQSVFTTGGYKAEESPSVSAEALATHTTATVDGMKVDIFKSGSYVAGDKATIIYFLHDGLSDSDLNRAVNCISTSTSIKSFKVAAFNGADLKGSFADVATDIDAAAGTFGVGRDYRLGIAKGADGYKLYDYSTTGASLLKALYLFDSTTGTAAPDSATYYYIDITDEGTNYNPAGELYLLCRQGNVPHDYRVRNGRDTVDSFVVALAASKSAIIQYIK